MPTNEDAPEHSDVARISKITSSQHRPSAFQFCLAEAHERLRLNVSLKHEDQVQCSLLARECLRQPCLVGSARLWEAALVARIGNFFVPVHLR